jgi:hypothetical protein
MAVALVDHDYWALPCQDLDVWLDLLLVLLSSSWSSSEFSEPAPEFESAADDDEQWKSNHFDCR